MLWTLTIKEVEKLLVIERKILLTKDFGTNGNRMETKIKTWDREPIVEVDVDARLRSFGLVESMGGVRAVKWVYLGLWDKQDAGGKM